MVRLDSISLKLPMGDIQKLNEDHFTRSWEASGTNQEDITSDLLKLRPKVAKEIVGLKSIHVDLEDESLKIEVSSKILKGDYFDMVNINTLERLTDEINKSGIIRINDSSLAGAEVLKADITQNLKPEGSLEAIFAGLSCLPLNDKYNVDAYNKPGNSGIVFSGRQTTFKERQIFYDKLKDIKRDKKLQAVVPFALLHKQFAGTLRVEGNFTSFKTLRQYTGLKMIQAGTGPTLLSVLQSQANPNLQLFDKITKKVKDTDLRIWSEWEGMKLYEIEKMEGRKGIIRLLNYDIVSIRAFLQDRVKGNTSNYLRQYRDLIGTMQKERTPIASPTLLSELRKLMSVA